MCYQFHSTITTINKLKIETINHLIFIDVNFPTQEDVCIFLLPILFRLEWNFFTTKILSLDVSQLMFWLHKRYCTTNHLCNFSSMKCLSISLCFVLLWWIKLFAIVMTFLLSQNRISGLLFSVVKSLSIFLRHQSS